jgi:hypothetical protein
MPFKTVSLRLNSSKKSKKMAKKVKKTWQEGELIELFKLTRIVTHKTPLMKEWLDIQSPELNIAEQYNFDKLYLKVLKHITGWNEEDLKIKFIGPILELGQLIDDEIIMSYFDRNISAIVDDIHLNVNSDLMLSKGILDFIQAPYFHFQKYSPYKNPSGDSMAQLLEAFLIAQAKNKNGNPIYGVDIIGTNWRFVTMEGRTYCISKAYDATNKKDLLYIISILRKFRWILETRLID